MKTHHRVLRTTLALVSVLLLGFLLLPLIPRDEPAESAARQEYLSESATATGAINVVSAIYLGYRAYDTMGEAVVLLLAVTGVSFFAGKEHT